MNSNYLSVILASDKHLFNTFLQGLDLSPLTSIESALRRDLLMNSMSKRNGFSKQDLFPCSHGHLTKHSVPDETDFMAPDSV